MSNRLSVWVCVILLVLATLLSAALYSRMPEQMATHWNTADQVNGTTPRFWGVLIMPLVGTLMLALLLILPGVDPMRKNIAAFRPVFNVFVVVMIAFLMFLHVLSLLWNLGNHSLRIGKAVLPGIGAIFIVAGWMMRQAKRNYSIGIRTPWTLASDAVWEQTHKVGAPVFYACGAIAVLAVLLPGALAFWLVIGPVLAATLGLTAYSYLLWEREQGATRR